MSDRLYIQLLHNFTVEMFVIYIQDGYTALIYASLYGHHNCIKLLLDNGAAIDLPDNVSLPPYLHT